MESKALWPGWEVVRVIGSGGFGKVYEIRKAEESRTGEYRSALKVISIPPSPDEYRSYVDDGYDRESITRILQNQVQGIISEFQMMSQFRGTSHIVSYEDHRIVPHESGQGWDILIRMELLTPLPDYFNQHGMSVRDTLRLGVDICRALELCGRENIIHRDIKPQNIFINRFGDFKLGDFGIAKSMDHTTRATKIGTYNYMAPEVYRGKPYGPSVDIYSLGLVMYWLLNERRLPFLPLPPAVPSGPQNEEAHARRLKGELLPLPKNGSAALQAAVLTACAADPEKRFASPTAFRRALESCGQPSQQRSGGSGGGQRPQKPPVSPSGGGFGTDVKQSSAPSGNAGMYGQPSAPSGGGQGGYKPPSEPVHIEGKDAEELKGGFDSIFGNQGAYEASSAPAGGSTGPYGAQSASFGGNTGGWGTAIPPGKPFSRQYTELYITRQEAWQGCQKFVGVEDKRFPTSRIRLTLKPGTRDGMRLRVEGFPIKGYDGREILVYLEVTVRVR